MSPTDLRRALDNVPGSREFQKDREEGRALAECRRQDQARPSLPSRFPNEEGHMEPRQKLSRELREIASEQEELQSLLREIERKALLNEVKWSIRQVCVRLERCDAQLRRLIDQLKEETEESAS
jgi:hypothetical protein